MASPAQTKALQNYRKRLKKRGMARFEVIALDRDRELIRSVARKLSEDGARAAEFRSLVRNTLTEQPRKGGILAALRRWPTADLNLHRSFTQARKIDL